MGCVSDNVVQDGLKLIISVLLLPEYREYRCVLVQLATVILYYLNYLKFKIASQNISLFLYSSKIFYNKFKHENENHANRILTSPQS